MKSNSESGAIQIGTIRVYGTGGTKGANWEAFSRAFYNPSENDMLPMETFGMLIKDIQFVVSFFLKFGVTNLI